MGDRARTVEPMAEEGAAPKGAHRSGAARIVARIAFAAVFLVNVQCALSFVLWPESFAGAYELSGAAGDAAVRGLGVAFLMWNATYPLVIADPARHRALAGVVLAQQVIGLVGETAILLSLPAGHGMLAGSIMRFIAFDAAGLVVMAAAFAWLCASFRKERRAAGLADDAASAGRGDVGAPGEGDAR